MTHLLKYISEDWRHSKFLPLAGKTRPTSASPPTTSGPWPFLPSDYLLSNQLFPKHMEHISCPDLCARLALSICRASSENSLITAPAHLTQGQVGAAEGRQCTLSHQKNRANYLNFLHTCIHNRITQVTWILNIPTMCVEKERTGTIWWNMNDHRA